MNLRTLTNYVNLDVDDTFPVQDITLWFNKGISNYNLIPPLTSYPVVTYGTGDITENTEYPLDDIFMLGIMLPFINSAVRGAEAALSEKQYFFQEYIQNARTFKNSVDIPLAYMLNKKNEDLSNYEMGEGVYLADFTRSPFAGEWGKSAVYSEIVVEDEE